MSPSLIGFLAGLGAGQIRHSRSTLLGHLEGTAALVKRWGATPEVQHAALFHSIYGTEAFHRAPLTFEDRPAIARLIGSEAERIAWIFCAFERASAFDALDAGANAQASYFLKDRGSPAWITVSLEELHALVLILWANLLEQGTRCGYRPSSLDERRFNSSMDVLPDAAQVDVFAFLAGLDPMRATRPSVATLLGRSFSRGKAWYDTPVLHHGPVERLRGLCDVSFDEAMMLPRSFAKAFWVKDGRTVSASLSQGKGEERRHYDDGHTIYLHSLHGPTLAAWTCALDHELGLVRGATRVSGFASQQGPGLGPHYDPNDNFVCQARGTKRWRYTGEGRVLYPTVGATMGNNLSPEASVETQGTLPTTMPEPVETVDMTPGSVFFMPRGYWHATETVTPEGSLHFNIQLGLATWKDALDFLATETEVLRMWPAFRGPVTHGFNEAIVSDDFLLELADRLRMLADRVAAGEVYVSPEAFRAFVARRKSA